MGLKKECGKCYKNLPGEEFHRNSSRDDGLAWACKSCTSEYGKHRDMKRVRARNRSWKARNPEKVREQKRRARERKRAERVEASAGKK